MATANPNPLPLPLPLGNGFPPARWTTEALLREMNRTREEAAGRDRPILYPTEDPNMVAINIGDLLVKKPKYGIPRRFDLTEEDMAMLRSLNQARKESRKNENKDINDPNNWPGTETSLEGGVSVLKRPLEDLNPAAAAANSSTTASGSEAQVEGGSVPKRLREDSNPASASSNITIKSHSCCGSRTY